MHRPRARHGGPLAAPRARHRAAGADRLPAAARVAVLLAIAALAAAIPAPASAQEADIGSWGIASGHPLATEAGVEVLAAGGNAFDAAVAVSAALAVVEPHGSGLGGGGFWLLHVAAEGRDVMVDGRERAPLAASATLYQDDDGELIEGASTTGPLAAGIPGEPAALVHIAERYGRLPLGEALAPAIRLAREGFAVGEDYRRMVGWRRDALQDQGAAGEAFLVDGEVPPAGHRLRQPDLARTLRALAREGRAGFYDGAVARRLVEGVRAAGGIWQRSDLERYRVVERPPIRGRYRDVRMVSAAPPSSGGVVLVEAFNVLSGFDLASMDAATRAHVVIEAMRRAYHDRARYLGDPDHVAVPVERLTDPRYAAGLRATLRLDRATPSAQFTGVEDRRGGGRDTTHFSVVDAAGNRVAATLSINWPFGSGYMPPGTGVVLNNEMDDFAAAPGVPNAYGLVQGAANAIAPGKRMLSSMSPTFLNSGDRVAVLGTPGGSRIISMVLLAALEFADGGDAGALVAVPRYHHQYLPDEVQHEPGALPEAVARGLRERGHRLRSVERRYGDMQVVIVDRDGGIDAASDPRGAGAAATGRVLEGPDGSRIFRRDRPRPGRERP